MFKQSNSLSMAFLSLQKSMSVTQAQKVICVIKTLAVWQKIEVISVFVNQASLGMELHVKVNHIHSLSYP